MSTQPIIFGGFGGPTRRVEPVLPSLAISSLPRQSMDKSIHVAVGIGKGCNRPAGECLIFIPLADLTLLHVLADIFLHSFPKQDSRYSPVGLEEP